MQLQRQVGNQAVGRLLRARQSHEDGLSGDVDADVLDDRASSEFHRRLSAEQGHGHGLPEDARAELEAGVGVRLQNVRIHTDHTAADLAAEVGARAFTLGQDVYFGRGAYDPASSTGYGLLAHEVTHTLQQPLTGGVGALSRRLTVEGSAAPAERQAQQVAERMSARRLPGATGWAAQAPTGRPSPVDGAGLIRRQPDPAVDQSLRGKPPSSTATLKEVLRLDQTVPIKGLAANQPNYVDRAIGRIESAPLGPDITLIPRTGGPGQTGISVLKGDFLIDRDPLAGAATGHNQVYVSREVAESVMAGLDALMPGTPNYAYYLKDGIIFPTILSDTTIPNLTPFIRKTREQHIQDLRATADLGEAVLWWYVGARFPIKVGPGGGAKEAARAGAKEAAKGGAAAAAAFDAAKVADELFAATRTVVNPGQRMLAAARQLGSMTALTAAQKVKVILEFFQRIGFAISKAGVVDDGARFVMYSEDSRYAFAFVKGTGEVLYGKINVQTLAYVWEVLK